MGYVRKNVEKNPKILGFRLQLLALKNDYFFSVFIRELFHFGIPLSRLIIYVLVSVEKKNMIVSRK